MLISVVIIIIIIIAAPLTPSLTAATTSGPKNCRSSVFRKLIVDPLPPEVPGALAELFRAHVSKEPLPGHLHDDALATLKRVPGISSTSVLIYIKAEEANLITTALHDDDNDGNTGGKGHEELTKELQQLLRWFVLLLPLAESVDCPDGASLLDEAALRAAAASFFAPPAPVDRATYLEAVVALGNALNLSASRTGGVGGAWACMNGKTVFNRMTLALRRGLYASPSS